MISDINNEDIETRKAYEAMSQPMQEMYHKEMEKYKKGEESSIDL